MTDAPAAYPVAIPYSDPEFRGHVGLTVRDSTPDFPRRVGPLAGAPNVLLILLDDLGFGQASVSGGPAATPHMSALATTGVAYNRFHTASLSSPTRAALLTGRNHHRVGFGGGADRPAGFPGYTCVLPRSAASIGAILTGNGYGTAWFGKNDTTPEWEAGAIGPFDRWPTGLGFEYFYGFLGAETSQWEPQLYEGITPVEPPDDESYHLTENLVDRTRAWITTQHCLAPDKPFFAYLALGAPHAPHHVPAEFIERYQGAFDHGWDQERERTLARQIEMGIVPPDTELTARPEGIAAWDSLPGDERRLFARMQEVYAGFVTHTDEQIGRAVAVLDELGIRENTLVIVIVGDSGPSAQGGPLGSVNTLASANGLVETVEDMLPKINELGGRLHRNHHPTGWAWAGAAPFAGTQQVASHFGGTRNLAVMSWPGHIPAGQVREQFHHVVDIVPTVLEATGVPAPTWVNGFDQLQLDGVSMAYTWPDPDALARRTTQYFELGGNRALYHDGWIACARNSAPWELYDVGTDFSQAHDLAAQYPEKVGQYEALFDREARANHVYPLDDRTAEAAGSTVDAGNAGNDGNAGNQLLPSITRGRTVFTYTSAVYRVPEGSAPKLFPRSHKITARLAIPTGGAHGVLVTQGGRNAGYVLYLDQDGRLVYHYNYFDREHSTLTSPKCVPEGDVVIGMKFTSDHDDTPGSGGVLRLTIRGRTVAIGRLERSIPSRFCGTETFDVGRSCGSPVGPDYRGPNPFSGALHKLTVEITG